MRVAITGASGLVGSRVVELLSDVDFVRLDRASGFDLEKPDPRAWSKAIDGVDAVVHLAAKTDVDAVEHERGLGEQSPAWVVNVEGTRALVRVSRDRGAPLILVSTDFVFPAHAAGPFREAMAPTADSRSTSWYGWTKAVAERAVLEDAGNAVLRISYPYVARHPTRTDHARRIIRLDQDGKLYPLYEDQQFTPSFVDDVAASLRVILNKRLAGILHCASTDRVTPFDFGFQLLGLLGRETAGLKRAKFPSTPQEGRAIRPRDGGLATTRSQRSGLVVRPLEESLREFARQFVRAETQSEF